MKSFNLRPLFAVSAVAASILLSACGPQNKLYSAPQGSLGTTVTNGNQTGSGVTGTSLAQRCSPMPNINGSGMNATEDRAFRACNGSTIGSAVSQVAIFPEDGRAKQVCVFALSRNQYNQTAPVVLNPYAPIESRYSVQCGVVAGSGSLMNFTGSVFQGAYIVAYSDAGPFAQCLPTGNVSGCANAYGIPFSVGFWN